MRKPLIKICGLTSFEDAKAAIDAGADWLGFIFVPESPRALSLETAATFLAEIKGAYPNICLIGVFKDMPVNTIQYHLEKLPLDAVQLHGNESVEPYSALGAPIIKVLLLHSQITLADLQLQAETWKNNGNVEAILLDLPKGSGMGSIMEWPGFNGLNTLISQFPCIVAGGLIPENVAEVIDALHPLGVDVASGVEQSPGKKDIMRMQSFCNAVKTFEPHTDSGESIPCNR